MTVCTRCHRQLKQPTETGMGPVCSKVARVQPIPAHERDLFGYEIEKAAQAALYRLQIHIDSMAAEAHMEVRKAFHRARVMLLRWAP